MSIVVYSKPNCVQCTASYRALEQRGISYNVVDISEDADSLALVRSMGYMQVPVIVTESDHWSGFRLDKINSLVRETVAA